MHRRDFLSPRRLAENAGQLLGAIDELQTSATIHERDASLLRLAWRAMATSFEIVLPFGTPGATGIATTAFARLDAFESQLTVYRDRSEVSRLNQLASRTAVRVEEGLFDLLRLSSRIHEETGGAFDVTAGALIKAWGFFRGPKRVPSADEIAAALERVGMGHVELDDEDRTVRFHRPGLEINLGSIGKGYALDRLAGWLRMDANLPSALLHGGTSSVYAIGTAPGEPRGWPVAIRHPWEPDRLLATVWLGDRALGTSAATWQHLDHEGKKLGHILDPRTGWPATGIASASVLAPTSAEADALSTAFFVGGIDAARRYRVAHPEIGAILLPEGEQAPIILGLDATEFCLPSERD